MTWWQLAFLITGIVLAIQGISIVVAITFGPRFLAWLTERLFKAMTENDSIKKRLKEIDKATENGEPTGTPFDPFAELDAARQAIEQILRGEDP
jgi:hypothetical protein